MYKILEQNSIDNQNIDGGAMNNFVAGNKDGIVKDVLSECPLLFYGNNIMIGTGLIMAHGIRVKIESPEMLTVLSTPTNDTYYHIVLRIKMKSNTDVTAEFLIQVAQVLTQENFYETGSGTYEVEIGRFVHTTSGLITELTKTIDYLYIQGGGDGSVVLANVDYSEEDEELHSIEIDGKVYRLPTFSGGGSGIVIDSQMSSVSVNPVQNKVVKAYVDTKFDTLQYQIDNPILTITKI